MLREDNAEEGESWRRELTGFHVPHELFVAHATEDKERLARPLAQALAHQGFRVWYDESNLQLGDRFEPVLTEAIRNSITGVPILSGAPRLRGIIHGMATTRNFHLPLPDPLYRRLRDAAERTKQPATTLARYAIDSWLRQHRKARLREAIAEYAVSVAGTTDDLDTDLEQASLDHLSEKRKRTKNARTKRKR